MSKKERLDTQKEIRDARHAKIISVSIILGYVALIIICYVWR